jgi:hypothetical protein
VRDPDQPREFVEVYPDGKRLPCEITHDAAIAYATKAAEEFGVGEMRAALNDISAAEQRRPH